MHDLSAILVRTMTVVILEDFALPAVSHLVISGFLNAIEIPLGASIVGHKDDKL